MQYILLFSLLVLTSFVNAQAEHEHLHPDGPYLLYDEDDQLTVNWAWPEERKAGQLVWNEANIADLPKMKAFRPETIRPDTTFQYSHCVTFSGVKKLAIVSDIHGQYDVIFKLLRSHDVIDEAGHWSFGEGHFVVVGDIFDRGDQVSEVLWLIYNLQLEAAAAGGRVHFLLGNHETMIMEGDIRYIHKRYLITGALLQVPYQKLYGPDSYLGRWLRSLPLTVKINDMVFVHGGLSKELVGKIRTLEEMNKLYHKFLLGKNAEVASYSTDHLELLYGEGGPLWYRGYFLEKDFSEKDIDRILKKVKATKMVVGHTSFNAIKSFFNGKVLAVDSSIKFGSMGEILLVTDGKFERGTLLGKTLSLEPSKR